ncbi:MAG: DUF3489 domain-containing protein [Alphaproteobacteria bacterium]|nr:DUF3489 domain-containing protein [Alphaproteobacteria bacterium]
MTTKKKSSKAKIKTTAKKQILTPVAEEPIVMTKIVELPCEPLDEPVEQPKPVKLTGSDKLTFMVNFLSRPEGATLKEMAEALGWKENSVRGAMSLYAKNHPEYTHSSEKVDGVRYYRLTKNGD